MRTHQQNFTREDIVWASALDVRTTTEIFAKSFTDFGLDGFLLQRANESLSIIDPSGCSVLHVDDVRGIVRREDGLGAVLILAKTIDLFPEVISAGYRDGRPFLLTDVTEVDLLARCPQADLDRMRTLAIRAGLLSAGSLSDCMRRHILSPTPPAPVINGGFQNTLSLG